jgi:putative nucleotidyltransferase with HDIG domain
MDINKQKTIDELIKRADDLPPLPKVAYRALRLLSKPEFNMKELGEILSVDQALTSTLLHWANSSYYGLRYPVSTVHQAVTYLGEVTVRSLVLTASLANYMDRPIPGYFLDRGELWKHSIGIAVAAKLLTKKINKTLGEEAYTAGLLCDIGKLAFDVSLRKLTIMPEWASRPFPELEADFLGIDHAQLGAEIARKWGFPEALQEAIAYHHNPIKANPHSILPSAVHVGDILVSMLGIGIGRDGLQYTLEPNALTQLKINETDFENLLGQVSTLIKGTEDVISS